MATATKTFTLGAQALLVGTFTSNGAAVDPTEIVLTVKAPSGAKTVKSYAAGELTRQAAGVYAYSFECTEPGRHYYTFDGSGAFEAVDESNFWVNPIHTN